jgi:hypothetical protein
VSLVTIAALCGRFFRRSTRMRETAIGATAIPSNYKEGFWGRMKRVMLGESAPDVEKK